MERGKGRAHTRNISKSSIVEIGKGRGKSAATTEAGGDTGTQGDGDDGGEGQELGPLVVLACRHIYHQSCLEAVMVDEGDVVVDGREFRCPIDG